MTITFRQLALLLVLAAVLASTLTFTIATLVSPQPAAATDKQIVRAIENTIGKYDYVGNSLRTSMFKKLTEIDRGITALCRATAAEAYRCSAR